MTAVTSDMDYDALMVAVEEGLNEVEAVLAGIEQVADEPGAVLLCARLALGLAEAEERLRHIRERSEHEARKLVRAGIRGGAAHP